MSVQYPVNSLAEETMIDPISTLPSFYEMQLVDATRESGRKTLEAILSALLTELRVRISSSRNNIVMNKIYKFIYGIVGNYKEEIQAVITYTIERQMLRSKVCATLSESVYGLTRSKTKSSNGKVSALNDVDRTRVALILALGPYLKHRLDKLYDRLRITLQEDRSHESNRCILGNDAELLQVMKKLKIVFVYFYPILLLSYRGTNLAYNFAYLLGKTVHYSPSLHALSLVVRRITSSDIESRDALLHDKKSESKDKGKTQFYVTMKGIATVTVTTALAIGWIGKLLKEIRMYRLEKLSHRIKAQQSYQHERLYEHLYSQEDYDGMKGVLLPPPLQPQVEMTSRNDVGLCPICRRLRINPVASSSGYVFCYKCIVLHMKEFGDKCPVTGLSCTVPQLIRLYESADGNIE